MVDNTNGGISSGSRMPITCTAMDAGQATIASSDPIAADDLRWFGAIADAGSISEAARRHDASKATLSRAVSRIEASAGAPVFDRVGRGLRLTPLGETLKPAADTALAAMREADEALRSATGEPAGRLRIAASALAAHQFLTPVVLELRERHPAVRVEFHITSRPVDPLAEDYDVCLHIGRPEQPSLIARRIVRAQLKLYAAPDAVLGVRLDDPDEVAGIDRIVVGAPGVPQVWHLTHEADGRTVTFGRDPIVQINDPTVATDVTRGGSGMLFVPTMWGEHMVERGEFVPVLPDWSGPTMEVFAVMPPRRANVPAVRAFLDIMFERARAL